MVVLYKNLIVIVDLRLQQDKQERQETQMNLLQCQAYSIEIRAEEVLESANT